MAKEESQPGDDSKFFSLSIEESSFPYGSFSSSSSSEPLFIRRKHTARALLDSEEDTKDIVIELTSEYSLLKAEVASLKIQLKNAMSTIEALSEAVVVLQEQVKENNAYSTFCSSSSELSYPPSTSSQTKKKDKASNKTYYIMNF